MPSTSWKYAILHLMTAREKTHGRTQLLRKVGSQLLMAMLARNGICWTVEKYERPLNPPVRDARINAVKRAIMLIAGRRLVRGKTAKAVQGGEFVFYEKCLAKEFIEMVLDGIRKRSLILEWSTTRASLT